MNPKGFLAELKRRNVYKVAITYAVVAWLLIQAASILLPTFEAPSWVMKAFVVFLAFGFVISVMISWAFEATPEGLKRTENVPPEVAAKLPTWSRRKFVTFVVLVAAIAAGLFVYQIVRTPPSMLADAKTMLAQVVPAKSIAVLPFDNLSRDPDNAFFAEGVQDEILTRLAKVADLKVISRTSTQQFKSKPDNLPQIAKQLGVAHILEGSVQRASDQVRVNVQLINALTDAHLWAETFDRKLTDIFAVESEIAKTVADTLQAKLTGAEKLMMEVQPTSNTQAYELYHKGRSLWEKRTGDNIPKAIALFEQAIARDPNYALAYAGLASAHILSPYYAHTDRRQEGVKAREAALKALSLDPNLAEAHSALGKVLFWAELNIAGAMREYERALELKPNDAGTRHWYGNDTLAALGRFEEAITEGRRAVALDPLSPIINADLGTTFFYAGRYDESAAQLRKTLEIDPTFFFAHYSLGIALQAKGDLSDAIAEYEKAKQLTGENLLVSTICAAAKAQAGDKDAARRILSELDEISKNREVVGYFRALLYLSLNNKDEALRWLEQGYEERDGSNMCWIKVDPLLDSLHGDPRFESLVQKVIAPKNQQ